MKQLLLKNIGHRRLPFYLATEEWAARTLPPGDYFFIWQVHPTVICGRHQNMDLEVDMVFCSKNNIDVVRRKSGGGCVYADMDNFMFSYICPSDEVTATFSRYTTMVADMLSGLGLHAVATGRNDIVIDNKKVSGNAFYHIPGRSIVHGTMLYDFDPSTMQLALTPTKAKLSSKGVKSVQSRVCGLRHMGLKMNKDEFRQYALDKLTDSTYEISQDEIKIIEEIEKTYYLPEFLSGRNADTEKDSKPITIKKRIDGIGEFETRINLDKENRIEAIDISGDYFILSDTDENLTSRLVGLPYSKEALIKALNSIDVSSVISGLDAERLLPVIID